MGDADVLDCLLGPVPGRIVFRKHIPVLCQKPQSAGTAVVALVLGTVVASGMPHVLVVQAGPYTPGAGVGAGQVTLPQFAAAKQIGFGRPD